MPDRAASTQTRPYRGRSAEERRAERRERLLDAGLELFGTDGVTATTVDRICAEAGLTKRYFYESFESPTALLDAVVDRAVDGLVAATLPAISSGGITDPAPALTAFFEAVFADPRLVRLLVVEMHGGPLAARRTALLEQAVDLWLSTAPELRGRGRRSRRTQALLRLRAHAFGGAAGEIALAWANGRIALGQDEVIAQIVELFHRMSTTTA